jgi:lipopolysaccharide transport system ATP-binding protein
LLKTIATLRGGGYNIAMNALAPAPLSPALPEAAIRIHNLRKTYKKFASPRARLAAALLGRKNYTPFHALKGIDATIAKGETVAIIGKNGSGKSTLLQILAGTLSPTEGSVEVHGKVAALLELGAGFNPEFTGRENVFLNAAILGLSQAETEARLPAILEFAEIGEAVDAPVKTYSSGMFMRLAFSVAAHVDADILIVDEALSVGDAFFVQKCMRYLRQFQKRGTVLFVSHDTNAVLGLCDRAIWLDGGEIRAQGPAKAICEQYLAAYYHGDRAEGSLNAPAAAHSENRKSLLQEEAFISDRKRRAVASDLEIFEFDPHSEGFGVGGGYITAARLIHNGKDATALSGGETVTLEIRAKAEETIERPIIGFFVKDRLGQPLFGENTFVAGCEAEPIPSGEEAVACFTFTLPLLATGDYAITIALADGTAEEHIQRHWMHAALTFRVHAAPFHHGIVGIPMQRVEFFRSV